MKLIIWQVEHKIQRWLSSHSISLKCVLSRWYEEKERKWAVSNYHYFIEKSIQFTSDFKMHNLITAVRIIINPHYIPSLCYPNKIWMWNVSYFRWQKIGVRLNNCVLLPVNPRGEQMRSLDSLFSTVLGVWLLVFKFAFVSKKFFTYSIIKLDFCSKFNVEITCFQNFSAHVLMEYSCKACLMFYI